MKNPKYAFCREYYSEYQVRVLFDDVTVTSFIDIKFCDVAIQSIP